MALLPREEFFMLLQIKLKIAESNSEDYIGVKKYFEDLIKEKGGYARLPILTNCYQEFSY